MDQENCLIRQADGDPARLKARVLELEAKLQTEKLDTVGRLAGGVAHDLNNLLTPILAYGNMLVEELPPGSSAREFAEEMVKAGDRIVVMTKLLQSLRVKPGSVVPVDSIAAVQVALQAFVGTSGSDVQVVQQVVPSPAVLFEGGMLEPALGALLSNARLAMPAGGKVTVTAGPVSDPVAAQLPAGGWVRLAVRDEGAGMASEVREHLFEPYFTTRPKGQGKGLGLATVYAATARAGGLLRCRSELGVGTEVELFLRQVPA